MRRIFRTKDEETSYWLSYSDMMAGLLLMFVIVISFTMMQAKSQYEEDTRKLLSQQTTLEEQRRTLEEQRETMETQQTTLEEQETTLQSQQKELAEKEAALLTQSTQLEEAKTTLDTQQQTMDQQQKTLDEQTKELEAQKAAAAVQQKELQDKQATVDSQSEQLISQQLLLAQQTETLEEQQRQLDEQRSALQSQTVKLEEQQLKIESQQTQMQELIGIRTELVEALKQAKCRWIPKPARLCLTPTCSLTLMRRSSGRREKISCRISFPSILMCFSGTNLRITSRKSSSKDTPIRTATISQTSRSHSRERWPWHRTALRTKAA